MIHGSVLTHMILLKHRSDMIGLSRDHDTCFKSRNDGTYSVHPTSEVANKIQEAMQSHGSHVYFFTLHQSSGDIFYPLVNQQTMLLKNGQFTVIYT